MTVHRSATAGPDVSSSDPTTGDSSVAVDATETDALATGAAGTEEPGADAAGSTLQRIELSIDGMTCASCAARIEKKLNRLDGVEAAVNYATERATVRFDSGIGPSVDPETLVSTVESTGYGATVVSSDGDRAARTTAQPPAASTSDADSREHAMSGDAALESLRQRLIISTLLTVPVVLMSMVPPLQFRNWQWLSLTLTAPVVIWGAFPFHRATWLNLRHRAVTMDTLISIGTLSAFAWSIYALFFGQAGEAGMTMDFSFAVSRGGGTDEIYLEVAAAVTMFLLAGRYFEARAKRRSGAALETLLDLGAKDVSVLRGDDGDTEVRVPIEDLMVGDRFVVRPGEKVATDGIIESGRSAIDASLLTGESMPDEVEPGDEVVGATLNANGRLVVRATRVGSDTALARIAQLVTEAQSGKAPVQRLADRVSAVFVPIVIVLAMATLVYWLIDGAETAMAFSAAVAVLIIACPCALGLATPTALLVGTGRGAQLGILIKGPEILESTRQVDIVVLDKTGTVTTGDMTLVDTAVFDAAPDHAPVTGVVGAVPQRTSAEAQQTLAAIAAVEDHSEHPIARAVVDGIAEQTDGAALPDVEDFTAHRGAGVSGTVNSQRVMAGSVRFMHESSVTMTDEVLDAVDRSEAAGRTPIIGAIDGAAVAVLVIADTPKPSSRTAIREIHDLGLATVLLTGDNERAARAVADEVGITEVIAGVRPEEKVREVQRLHDAGHVVAMVGDGVNDAAALATADLGISMGSGTDAAIEASDLTLVRSDLRSVPDAIRLSRRTLATIKGNLFWAFAYNVAALPLAAAGLLNPMIAGAAMALSSVFVVTNSLRLRRFRSTATVT